MSKKIVVAKVELSVEIPSSWDEGRVSEEIEEAIKVTVKSQNPKVKAHMGRVDFDIWEDTTGA